MQMPLMITSKDRALRAMQEIELEGLKEIDRICRKHGIKYSLGGGTCLGRVRHGGFIPWDDDIDVDMTLDNYDKFMSVAPEELDSSRFRLYTRDNDPDVYRSSARIGILDTRLSLTNWERSGRECNVFVDIFRCAYMPDDEKRRKKIASRLFFIRCVQHYKELGEFANKLNPRHKLPVRIVNSVVPAKILRSCEEHLVRSTEGTSGWILDDSIMHGAYGGYPSEGVDDYADVQFEGITVMDKKDPHAFLVSLYGKNYMDWLPPVSRISHHKWTEFDLGHYADDFGLDESYKDFMSVNYTAAKLRQMKKVSDSMLRDISAVCDKNGIGYVIPKQECYDTDFQDYESEYWSEPGIIMMLREDYDRFAGICRKELGQRMTYQSHETNPDYYYDHARVHLNYTQIRDKHMRLSAERKVHSGFFVKVIPLDNYPDNMDIQNELSKMSYWRRILHLKWRTPDTGYFQKLSSKNKMKLLMNRRYSLDDLYNKLNACTQKYNSTESSLCFDSSGEVGYMVFRKDEILSGREVPVGLIQREPLAVNDIIKWVSKRYGPCYLTYYDEPERQLSAWRYDEKSDRLLSNEEVLDTANKDH